jgi:uncharacterized membrane protein
MYPDLYGWWFLAMLLMVALPLLVLAVFALIVSAATSPSDDRALRIEKERAVRREIEKEQLGVLLNAL